MKKVCPITKNLIDKSAKLAAKGVPWSRINPVGVDNSLFNKWVRLGRAMNDEMSANGQYPKGSGPLEWKAHELFLALEDARNSCVMRNVIRIDKAAQRNWQAASKLLEICDKENFGRGAQVNISADASTSKPAEGESTAQAQIIITIPDNGRSADE